MLKELFVVFILSSVILLSGCTMQDSAEGDITPVMESGEEEAINELEQEMEKAIENMTAEDVENLIVG